MIELQRRDGAGRDATPPLRSGGGTTTPPSPVRSVRRTPRVAVACAAALLAAPLLGGEADVLEGVVTPLGDGSYRIDATVRHDDTGWEHYANRWDVLAPDGTLLGSRELLHPHVEEQPFTRSLTLEIPDGIERVTLRAADSVHDTGGASVELDVPR